MLTGRGAAMLINGSIPIHVARAYGVKPPAAPIPAVPAAAARPAEGVSSLVAGRVARPVDFAAEPAPPGHAYQLYTRAADKIEAAVAVTIGRAIDVTG